MDELEFINAVVENLVNIKVENFSVRFIGYDYTKEALDLAECLAETYAQMPEEELSKFVQELISILQ